MALPAQDRGEFTASSIAASLGATVGFAFGPVTVTSLPLGLFMVEMSKEFNWNRSTFFVIMTMSAWTAAAVAPFAGRWIDRVGARRVVVPGVFLYGLATASMALIAPSAWRVLLCCLAVGIMAGVQSPIGFSKVVASWFNRWRAFMLAVTLAIGGGVGGVLVPIFVHALIQAHGWRFAYAGLGAAVSLIATPLLFLLLRMPAREAPARVGAHVAVARTSRRAALRTPAFWIVLVVTAISVGPMVAVLAHCIALVTDKGFSSGTATAVLALMGAGGTVGQLASGYFFDRFQTPKVAIPTFALGLAGFLLMHLGQTASTLMLAGALIGVGRGAEGVVPAYFTTRYFGLPAFGQIFGLIYGASVILAGAGPVLMGLSFDKLGSYMPMLIGAEIAFVACMLLIAQLGPYVFPADGIAREPAVVPLERAPVFE